MKKQLKNITMILVAAATAFSSVIPVMAVDGNANISVEESASPKSPSVEISKTSTGYTLEISNIPTEDGVFFETELGKTHFSLSKPFHLDEKVTEKMAKEGLNCIESLIQDEKSRRSELIVFDPTELKDGTLPLNMIGQSLQLDNDSRVLQVSYVNTSGLDGKAFPADAVNTTDYLYVNGESERNDEASFTQDHFFMSDELSRHVVELISSYRAFSITRDEVYDGMKEYFDERGLCFDYEKYFEDYAKEHGISDIAETLLVTDVGAGEIARTRRVFLTQDKMYVLSTVGNTCSLYSLLRPGKVVTESNLDWFDIPEEREILYPEHHLFYDNSQGTFLYSVLDKDSRLITNWDTFAALRKELGR